MEWVHQVTISFMSIIVEILNGVLSGIDIFESDYPLTMAEQGKALQIEDITVNKEDKKEEVNKFLEISK